MPSRWKFIEECVVMNLASEKLSDRALRKLRGLFGSGVTVVTTVHDGRLRGMAVSAFVSISFEPPLVMISLAHEAGTCEMIAESGVFAVNILSDDQEFLSERFAARAPIVNEKFEGVSYEVAVTGSPILPESIAWYDCRVEVTHDGGDHLVIIGRVVALGFGDEVRRPLLYYANRYAHLKD
jgi:3-hydroxy-9,10-secoandrosta-1,3,5(10)-triene-9,17-dione monooxygenase reductase component